MSVCFRTVYHDNLLAYSGVYRANWSLYTMTLRSLIRATDGYLMSLYSVIGLLFPRKIIIFQVGRRATFFLCMSFFISTSFLLFAIDRVYVSFNLRRSKDYIFWLMLILSSSSNWKYHTFYFCNILRGCVSGEVAQSYNSRKSWVIVYITNVQSIMRA